MADYIFGIAHIKAGVQALTGNKEGAKQTLRNNFTKGLLVSHINAGICKLAGDDRMAKECWKGGNRTLSSATNSIPVVGHAKAGIHALCGDTEGAKEALVAATRTTAVMGAGAVGLVAGPVGAVAAGVAVGASWDVGTAIVTDGKRKPGVSTILDGIDKWENWLDALISLAGDGLGGLSGFKLTQAVRARLIKETGNPSVPVDAVEAAQNLVEKYEQGKISFAEYNAEWEALKKANEPIVRPVDPLKPPNAQLAAKLDNYDDAEQTSSHFNVRDARSQKQESQNTEKQSQNTKQQQQKDGVKEKDEQYLDEDEDSRDDDTEQEESTEEGRSALAELIDLIKKIREYIRNRRFLRTEERQTLYHQLEQIIEELIHNHRARFVERTRESMILVIGLGEPHERVIFDEELRRFFQGVPQLVETTAASPELISSLSVIYRIFCRYHSNWNYVGQTINNVANRGNSHHGAMGRASTANLNLGGDSDLADHADTHHRHEDHSDVYEIEILRHLPHHGDRRNPEHRRVRRAWEIFYQWVYGAWRGHGGPSRR